MPGDNSKVYVGIWFGKPLHVEPEAAQAIRHLVRKLNEAQQEQPQFAKLQWLPEDEDGDEDH